MYEVSISAESVIKSVLAWSALHNQMGREDAVLGLPAVEALKVMVKDKAEELGASLFPWIHGFDPDTLTYVVSNKAVVSSEGMLMLLTLFERAVTYAILQSLSEDGDVEGGRFVEFRTNAIAHIRNIIRGDSCACVRPQRW